MKTLILTLAFSSFTFGADNAMAAGKVVHTTWHKAWVVGYNDLVFSSRSCDRGQLLDLKDTAEQDALDTCQEQGLRHCQLLGSRVLLNGQFEAQDEFDYGLSQCDPRKESCIPMVNQFGCVVRASAAGE